MEMFVNASDMFKHQYHNLKPAYFISKKSELLCTNANKPLNLKRP